MLKRDIQQYKQAHDLYWQKYNSSQSYLQQCLELLSRLRKRVKGEGQLAIEMDTLIGRLRDLLDGY